MIYFLLIILLLLTLVSYLPIEVEIDTEQDLYKAGWRGIMRVWGIPDEGRWRWFFRILCWQREWKPGADSSKRKSVQPKTQKPAGKRKGNFSLAKGRLLMRHMLRAIRLKRLKINWDTGDFLLNAWLYPVFQNISRPQRRLSINFKGDQVLVCHLYTRPGLLILAGLRYFFTIKK